MKPHVHAALIKAWADGATIQRCGNDNVWRDCDNPMVWHIGAEYRIKPEPTDLEKYGVEVGDVWTTSLITTKNHLVVQAVLSKRIITCMERLIHKEDLSLLLFRRGEVNKL
jgi:hypothetical protein